MKDYHITFWKPSTILGKGLKKKEKKLVEFSTKRLPPPLVEKK